MKLPPFIIIPRKTPLPNYIPPTNVIVYYKPNSKTFDSEVMANGVIRRVLVPHIMRHNQTKPLLFLDSAPCHKTTQVQDALEENNIDYELIPPRMTNLVQPQDVSFIKVSLLYLSSFS